MEHEPARPDPAARSVARRTDTANAFLDRQTFVVEAQVSLEAVASQHTSGGGAAQVSSGDE